MNDQPAQPQSRSQSQPRPRPRPQLQPEPWVPDACTLPTAERPVRSAEFDAVFAGLLREAAQLSPTLGRWTFTADAAQAADLAGLLERESSCCSFFTFALTRDAAGSVVVDVTVPAAHAPVLAALTQRAAQLATQLADPPAAG